MNRFALTLVGLLAATPAIAQLAPTGGHYGGRPSDTGHEPGGVNASGGYGASVPLNLPPARGGLPIPLQIVSGTRGVGAAGLGWDVPLSFVRRDTSFARRRPQDGGGFAAQAREQVTLTLQGSTSILVPRGTEWVPRVDGPDLKLREQSGAWLMFDGQGRTYRFTTPAALAGTGLWLLESVSGTGGSTVALTYNVSTPALTGEAGLSVNLARIAYNTHPGTGCAKHELVLNYGPSATAPLALSMLGDRVLARMDTLERVDVMSRATCGSSLESLRQYALAYLPDADTGQPRLRSVQMYGRQGSAEQFTAIPIATYGYGSATNAGKLRYQKTQSIPLPPDADSAQISSTFVDNTLTTPTPAWTYATWQSFTDVTGDGRPDVVYPKNGKLWVTRNRPAGAGLTVFDNQTDALLGDATLPSGPLENRGATNNRFSVNGLTINIDKVWRKAVDVNGDGRIDIIDAAETPGQWVVYLNTPGMGASGIQWERRTYAIYNLYNHLRIRGHDVQHNQVPLASRFTGRSHVDGACWKYNGNGWDSYSHGFSTGECGHYFPQGVLSSGPEQTFTEWELTDFNGDGYPDLVFNSSPVVVASSGEPQLSASPGAVINIQNIFTVQPRQGDGNNIDAVLNLRGMLVSDGTDPFSLPLTVKSNTGCGVGLWAAAFGTQEAVCGIADVNGDGLADRIQNREALLGTGKGFSPVTLTLPGRMSKQQSAQVLICANSNPPPPGSTPSYSGQSAGLRDLTGDGVPDYVEAGGASWQVAVGTGAGFAPFVDIDVIGSSFSFSAQTERCDGTASSTTSGLYDVDGDGKADVVRLSAGNLDVYQLAGGQVPRTPEAGRLVQVDNGFGATTLIGYRSAKEDGTTAHQVPFPEVVVSSVETQGTQGLGGSLSPVRYAYGGAEMIYDAAFDAFTLPAYARSVALTVHPSPRGTLEGRATVTETYGLAPYTATPKSERFARYVRVGRVKDVTILSGTETDPWRLLAVDLSTDNRRISGTHYDWSPRLFEEPPVPGTGGFDCMEMMYPYDFFHSFYANVGDGNYFDACSAHGFVYGQAKTSWRGSAAPPSTDNVQTRSEVLEVDDFGRVTRLLQQKDIYRSDDDVCIETSFAKPTGQNERVLSAPSSKRVANCNKPGGPAAVTYGAESWVYDGLAPGSVSSGLPTAHFVERRATDNGALLSTVRDFDAAYDSAGSLVKLTRVRDDGAVRISSLEYEPFGLAPVRTKITATATPSLEVTAVLDPLSLELLSATDPNFTQRGAEYDGFGREVRSTVTPPGGSPGVLSTVSYLGFSGTDPLGRRIVAKSFSDPVAPASAGSAIGRVHVGYLDELGRSRRTEIALGADYANQTLIAGARSYDGLGRVAFEADAFPSSQSAATAYGTTYHFRTDGFPSCFIRGSGPQPLSNVTNETQQRYPSCFFRTYANHEATLGATDGSAHLGSSPQAGVIRNATLSGAGRVLSRSTWQGSTRLEHATFTHNQVGQMTAMTRFRDPVSALNPLQTSWRFDSFGQLLQWQEPEGAPQYTTHNNWGELLEVRWTDSSSATSLEHRMLQRYDALGRATHREERINGVVDPDSVSDYFYDVAYTVTPEVTPTFTLGRLAKAQSPTGEVAFSFDAFGQVNARTFSDTQGGHYVEKSGIRADGSLSSLEFYLPDNGFQQERFDYGYDSAARLRQIKVSGGVNGRLLYDAADVDPWGRVRKATYGGTVVYAASYADLGRRLIEDVIVESASGSRRISYLGFDPMGREMARQEFKSGASTGPNTNVAYDALGRLVSSVQTDGALTLSSWQFSYDALGNVLKLSDLVGSDDAALSYRPFDRDRVCRIEYGNGGLTGTTCNVVHDAAGNVVEEATRTGVRYLTYGGSGNIRRISDGLSQADFRYDAFGNVQELDIQSNSATNARRDRRYGGLIERRDELVAGTAKSFISRQIPGPGGVVASRRGPGKEWAFHFAEQRGSRFFTDANGAFVQEVEYQPFGEAKSSGAQAGSIQYTNSQWNGGDALGAFGLSHLGARLYDPVIGRFLSRDPLVIPRTAATTNPYAFAINDPLNLSDPSGRDFSGCMGRECLGPDGLGLPSGFGGINPPGLYFPAGPQQTTGANPQSAYRPPTPTTFINAPKGPQTAAGRAMKSEVEDRLDVTMGDNFNFDTLAATGASLDSVMEMVEQTPEAHAAVDNYNAYFDSTGSFFAGLGDAVWFWCPGCAANARRTWNIKSGDSDRWAYGVGTFTGIVGSVVAPNPTSVIAEPPVATSTPPVGSIRNINFTKGDTNCVNCALATDLTLAGYPMAAMSGPVTSPSVLSTFFGRSWIPANGIKGVATIMRGGGPGSRGIVWGTRGAEVGHVFNVVNQKGVIRFLDGQEGGAAVLTGFDGFHLLRTN